MGVLTGVNKLNLSMDPFEVIDKIPSESIRLKVLDQVMNRMVPFNRPLGFKLKKLTPSECVMRFKNRRKVQNHVATVHACALATAGEYVSGVLLARNFSPKNYRLIIKNLNIEYSKQARDLVQVQVEIPEVLPDLSEGQGGVEMVSELTDQFGALLSQCKTTWQIKRWSLVKKR